MRLARDAQFHSCSRYYEHLPTENETVVCVTSRTYMALTFDSKAIEVI